MFRILAALTLLFVLSAPLARAAEESAPVAQPSDMDRRLELARKMHEIRPASQQVEFAIDRAVEKLPEQDRQAFRDQIMKSVDVKKLEDISVRAMAGIFTAPELEGMVGWFSSPEARSVAEKMPAYQAKVQPEIIKMLDAATMAARTGSTNR